MGFSYNLQKPRQGLSGTLPGKLVFGVPGPKGEDGLSAEAKVLLITILQEGTYASSQSENIQALALALGVELNTFDPISAILGAAFLGEMVLGG